MLVLSFELSSGFLDHCVEESTCRVHCVSPSFDGTGHIQSRVTKDKQSVSRLWFGTQVWHLMYCLELVHPKPFSHRRDVSNYLLQLLWVGITL